MAWIMSYQELGRHPKTKRLARLLDCSLPTAVGHLQYLWWWALDFAQDGDLSGYDPAELADAALWEGDPATLLTALQQAGFVETDHTLHDWDQYAGRLVEDRQANAAKQRAFRERRKALRDVPVTGNTGEPSRDGNVTVMSPSRNGATEHNTTVHNRESDRAPAHAPVDAPPREAEPVDADWDAMARAPGAVAASDDPAVAVGERGARPKRGPLPPDFALTPERAAWARDHCPHVISPLTATAKFATHYRATSDRRTLAEWDSKWQAWLLGDEERALTDAARRGQRAPTAADTSPAENPHTRAQIERYKAAQAERDARIAARGAPGRGVH